LKEQTVSVSLVEDDRLNGRIAHAWKPGRSAERVHDGMEGLKPARSGEHSAFPDVSGLG
jgi:hypothetical protein